MNDVPCTKYIHILTRDNDQHPMKSLVVELSQSMSPDKRLSALPSTILPTRKCFKYYCFVPSQKQSVTENVDSAEIGHPKSVKNYSI